MCGAADGGAGRRVVLRAAHRRRGVAARGAAGARDLDVEAVA